MSETAQIIQIEEQGRFDRALQLASEVGSMAINALRDARRGTAIVLSGFAIGAGGAEAASDIPAATTPVPIEVTRADNILNKGDLVNPDPMVFPPQLLRDSALTKGCMLSAQNSRLYGAKQMGFVREQNFKLRRNVLIEGKRRDIIKGSIRLQDFQHRAGLDNTFMHSCEAVVDNTVNIIPQFRTTKNKLKDIEPVSITQKVDGVAVPPINTPGAHPQIKYVNAGWRGPVDSVKTNKINSTEKHDITLILPKDYPKIERVKTVTTTRPTGRPEELALAFKKLGSKKRTNITKIKPLNSKKIA